jgi:hypothetical protein
MNERKKSAIISRSFSFSRDHQFKFELFLSKINFIFLFFTISGLIDRNDLEHSRNMLSKTKNLVCCCCCYFEQEKT